MTCNEKIFTVDISPYVNNETNGKMVVAKSVSAACKEIGCLFLKGHGISQSIIDETIRVSKEFFDLPLNEKLEASSKSWQNGFVPFESENIGKSQGLDGYPPDPIEKFTIGTVESERVWPNKIIGFKETVLEYYQHLTILCIQFQRIAALALGLPENYFDDKFDKSANCFRILNYPVVINPKPNQLRCAEHTDATTFTILYCSDEVQGLQVKTRKGEWVDIYPKNGHFFVNIGDLLMRWTNDEWLSTPHRVIFPPQEKNHESRRLSMIFFHVANPQEIIECLPHCQGPNHPPKYAPIFVSDYINRKLTAQTGQNVSNF